MILFILFNQLAFSKNDDSVFQMLSLHSSNFTVNFAKMKIRHPSYLTISPSSLHPKYEFHNLRAFKSINPFIISTQFTKFDLRLTSSHFSKFLSSVIFQTSVQQLEHIKFNEESKNQLYNQMQIFYESDPPSIEIIDCEFTDIAGNLYNDKISAALRLVSSHNGSKIIISDSRFIHCQSADLSTSNSNVGGALYILTTGNQPCSIEMSNLLFSECYSYESAAFKILSECEYNLTHVSCRNINVSDCINNQDEAYYDGTLSIAVIQNCIIDQFANILFENMNMESFLTNILVFSNCDGTISSLQFTNISYKERSGVLQISQDDGISHSLTFDGIGYHEVNGALPIIANNAKSDVSDLNIVIENVYYPNSDFMSISGKISTSISITYTETDGMNVITPLPTVSMTFFATPSVSPVETPTETPAETLFVPTDSPPTENVTQSQSEGILDPSMTLSGTSSDTYQPEPNETDNEIPTANPNLNERSITSDKDVGLIVSCTVAAVVFVILVIAIILIVRFCCNGKLPCCQCCQCCICYKKTAFQPSDEESKTDLCFFDETLNQAAKSNTS